MYVFICVEHKLCVWWSAKCGCTMLKHLFYYLTKPQLYLEDIKKPGFFIHVTSPDKGLEQAPKIDTTSFKHVLVCRNPYERIVSGFVNMYIDGYLMKLNKDDVPVYNSFQDYVTNLDYIIHNSDINSESHHSTPQLSEGYDPTIKFDRIIDINNFDFEYFGALFKYDGILRNDPVIQKLYNANTHKDPHNHMQNAHLMTIAELRTFKKYNKLPPYCCFLKDKTILDKINEVYKVDLEFFKQNGFDYKCPMC